MGVDLNLVDSLLAEHGKRPEEMAGENGWLKELTKAILERALIAELSDHLGVGYIFAGELKIGFMGMAPTPGD